MTSPKELAEWLYVLRPARLGMLSEGPTEAERAGLGRHFAYLEELTKAGTVILAGRTDTTGEETMGLVVFRSESEETARAIMAGDPALREGIMTATLYPFRVALHGR